MIQFYQEVGSTSHRERAEIMTDEQIKTVLRVMNLTAPFSQLWVCERHPAGDYARRLYDVQATLRFYLVPDDSNLLDPHTEGMIRA